MTVRSQFERFPAVTISTSSDDCSVGWSEVVERLRSAPAVRRIAIECYPAVDVEVLHRGLVAALSPQLVLNAAHALLPPAALIEKFALALGDDPVFGHMTPVELEDFFDLERMRAARDDAESVPGLVVALGTGATLLLPSWDILIYVDVCRWEIQQRQRRGEVSNLGLGNAGASPGDLYKRAFFLDWRAADRHRHNIFPTIDFYIDGNIPDAPAMVDGATLRSALAQVVRQPFSVVPFFDPGPWGGEWMRRNFGLPDGPPNYAWCFNCVPEENSLALRFGDRRFELPALVLVHEYPDELLGERVVRQFGSEFPIRFDFLDTVGGGNLSLQVHPLRSYIRAQFGLSYTQDESYYMLDAAPGATVYLGLREGIDAEGMEEDLRSAQAGGPSFPAEKYVNVWPARKHDHFLIPAGTIHCSGANSMVLEISATPYIFTFKLWDWGRLGLNGRPRPIHLDHGLRNIQWDRTTNWVREHLIDQEELVAEGDGWREERTGLHPLEFLETRRHWFSAPVCHNTHGNLNVLNLVEGEAAVVESPSGAFAPFSVHYAETFIVPACVGAYSIRPAVPAATPLATIKAYVREGD